jgi:hypothetical protein
LYRRGGQAGYHHFISEDNLRCPIEQAEQPFVALKQMRREVRFVRFRGENHELSRRGKPSHRRQRFGSILFQLGLALRQMGAIQADGTIGRGW